MINFNIPPTHNPFVVPEHYFATLSERVMAQCKVMPKAKRPVRLVPAWLPYAGVACVAALVAVFSCVLNVSLPDGEMTGTNASSKSQQVEHNQHDAADYAYEYFAANNSLGYFAEE